MTCSYGQQDDTSVDTCALIITCRDCEFLERDADSQYTVDTECGTLMRPSDREGDSLYCQLSPMHAVAFTASALELKQQQQHTSRFNASQQLLSGSSPSAADRHRPAARCRAPLSFWHRFTMFWSISTATPASFYYELQMVRG